MFPEQAMLIVEGGPDGGKTLPLNSVTTSLGRDSENDVVVDGPGVSARHAEISTEVDYYLADLSSNGTRLNGANLAGSVRVLADEDRFSLASSEVTFTFHGGDEAVLTVEGGVDDSKRLPLGAGTTTLGRQSDSDVVVDELGVSRQHAEVSTETGYYLTDLSDGETYVNEVKPSDSVHLLVDGDRVQLGNGDVIFTFRGRAAGTLMMKIVPQNRR